MKTGTTYTLYHKKPGDYLDFMMTTDDFGAAVMARLKWNMRDIETVLFRSVTTEVGKED